MLFFVKKVRDKRIWYTILLNIISHININACLMFYVHITPYYYLNIIHILCFNLFLMFVTMITDSTHLLYISYVYVNLCLYFL